MRVALVIAGLVVLGGSFAIVVAARNSDGVVSLGAAPKVAGSAIANTLPSQPSFEVWFTRGERIVPATRFRQPTPGVATAAIEALLAGPSKAERRAGVTTAVPAGTRLLGISIANGVAKVDLTSEYESGGGSLSMQMRLGQVVYTMTQFPTVKAVRFKLDGASVDVFSGEGIVLDHAVDRSDYSDLAPAAVPVSGTWRLLPRSPIAAPDLRLSAWTGKEMIVFGRVDKRGSTGEILGSTNVAAAYDPAANTWRRLAPPLSAPGYAGRWSSVWTGKDMIVLGDVEQAFNPATNRWRRLPPAPAGRNGIAVWTGRELIEWGGGCCGDVSSDGAAYDPSADSWRTIAPPPVAGQQSPVGAWTDKVLVIFPGRSPEGNPVGGAAYNPATNTWRRIGSKPTPLEGAYAVWDGYEVLVAGGTRTGHGLLKASFAFNPATNRFRRLSPIGSGRSGTATVWTGRRLLVWGGETFPGASVTAGHGLSYDSIGNHWSPLPRAPLPARVDPTAVWTGRELIVWGGRTTACRRNAPCHTKFHADGASFRPAAP
ncbi:MAG: GerMN domain-containing protein [Actinomycetota bacterium]